MRGSRRLRIRWNDDALFWRHLLWALVFPKRTQKVSATVPGLVLIVLAVGIGVAAYNSANNILFITLSLLLGCLILSGVLSWLNFKKVRWWLELDAPMRAGKEHPAVVHVRNEKKLLPVLGLLFEVRSTSVPAVEELVQRERIDPQGEAEFPWILRPARRGIERVELLYVGSLYPFGFLRKSMAARTSCDVTVWPEPVEYRRFPVLAWKKALPGRPVARVGQSGDLLALRDFRPGDSHRQIHWKASARLRHLVVRQFSADSEENFTLWLTARSDLWKPGEQFETLCSLAATLAEDLFKAGRLEAVAVNDEPKMPVRSVRDLEAFLDKVALLKIAGGGVGRLKSAPAKRNVLTFMPEGPKGVAAYVDGQKAAST